MWRSYTLETVKYKQTDSQAYGKYDKVDFFIKIALSLNYFPGDMFLGWFNKLEDSVSDAPIYLARRGPNGDFRYLFTQLGAYTHALQRSSYQTKRQIKPKMLLLLWFFNLFSESPDMAFNPLYLFRPQLHFPAELRVLRCPGGENVPLSYFPYRLLFHHKQTW